MIYPVDVFVNIKGFGDKIQDLDINIMNFDAQHWRFEIQILDLHVKFSIFWRQQFRFTRQNLAVNGTLFAHWLYFNDTL